MGLFGGLQEEGWVGTSLGKCVICRRDASHALRANKGSTEGVCDFREDLCETHWKEIKVYLRRLLKRKRG